MFGFSSLITRISPPLDPTKQVVNNPAKAVSYGELHLTIIFLGTERAGTISTKEMEEIGIASDCHSRHPSTSTIMSGPLPTDSMITVRLSDPPVASPLEKIHPSHHHVVPVLEETDSISDTKQNALISEEETQDMARDSVVSMTSVVEDEPSIATSGTIRSRSDTSGSLSSNNSAHVDWEKLEKSEEKAPRDEGSDEVGALALDSLLVS